jgi:hypothetical protein
VLKLSSEMDASTKLQQQQPRAAGQDLYNQSKEHRVNAFSIANMTATNLTDAAQPQPEPQLRVNRNVPCPRPQSPFISRRFSSKRPEYSQLSELL